MPMVHPRSETPGYIYVTNMFVQILWAEDYTEVINMCFTL